MKKIILLLIIITVVITSFYFLRLRVQSIKRLNDNKLSSVSPTNKKRDKTVNISKKSIFIPYWSLSEDVIDINYDRYIYFGITANNQGIDKKETGYLNLDKFVNLTQGKKTLLTLRLLNDNFNKELLKDEALQQKIIEQTLEIVKEKNFSGIVLDIELFSLFNTDITEQINDFVKRFYTVAKSDYRSLATAVYGDVFFRHRPFDIGFISANSDEILVMAYDFHKSRGEPGPNFPFARRLVPRSPPLADEVGSRGEGGLETQIYDYDFKTMIKDFTQIVPKDKLTVIFGMFGYDWTVDEKKRPFAPAKALTLNEIKNKFFNGTSPVRSYNTRNSKISCSLKDCIVKRDDVSKETEINYTVSSQTPDEEGKYQIDYHIIWFEDEESVRVKTEYLQGQGIGRIGYWAGGYF